MSLLHYQVSDAAQESCPKHTFAYFGSFLALCHRAAGQVELPSVAVILLLGDISSYFLHKK